MTPKQFEKAQELHREITQIQTAIKDIQTSDLSLYRCHENRMLLGAETVNTMNEFALMELSKKLASLQNQFKEI